MLKLFTKQKVNEIQYPREFWFLFWGLLLNRITASMIWPFLTVYMYQTLGQPLTTITLLFPLRTLGSIVATFFISPIMDKTGRKGVMVVGLIASGLIFFVMAMISTLPMWGVTLLAFGAVMPIFTVAVNTMVADIVPADKRAPAYALMRTIENVGIAIGPVIGGVLAVISFQLVFWITGGGYLVMAVLAMFFITETIPSHIKPKNDETIHNGFALVLRDWHFMSFLGIYFLLLMSYVQMFSLLPVYASENFGLAENQYSLMITVNAVMVVFGQYSVTEYTEKFDVLKVMIIGGLFYTVGLWSFVGASVLWHFMLSVAIVTVGELIVVPTATTLVANLAPDHMRARYLGLLSLGYPIGSGLGPVIGGMLNDRIAPVAIWHGAAVMALLGTLGFVLLSRIWQRRMTLERVIKTKIT